MRKVLGSLIGLFALAAPAFAQQVVSVVPGVATAASVPGVSGYHPILIRYIGATPAGGTVTVAAAGQVTLKTGPVSGSTADLTTECPVSGALGGVIDTTNAACNTLGEVVDAINASANWRAVVQDGLRSDNADNTLVTLAETSATKPEGLALNGDTSILLGAKVLLTPIRDDIRVYLSGTGLKANPFVNSVNAFVYGEANATLTGADTKSVIFSQPTNKACTLTASAVVCSATEVTRSVTSTGAGTGAASILDFRAFGLFGKPGERVLFGAAAATTYSAVAVFTGAGAAFPAPAGANQ